MKVDREDSSLVVLVSRDRALTESLRRALSDEFSLVALHDVDEAGAFLTGKGRRVGVVVAPAELQLGNGKAFLKYVRHHHPQILQIVGSNENDHHTVDGVLDGSYFDFIRNPWEARQLRSALRRALAFREAERERTELKQAHHHQIRRLQFLARLKTLVAVGRTADGQTPILTHALLAYSRATVPVWGQLWPSVEEETISDLSQVVQRELAPTVAVAERLKEIAQQVDDAPDIETAFQTFWTNWALQTGDSFEHPQFHAPGKNALHWNGQRRQILGNLLSLFSPGYPHSAVFLLLQLICSCYRQGHAVELKLDDEEVFRLHIHPDLTLEKEQCAIPLGKRLDALARELCA